MTDEQLWGSLFFLKRPFTLFGGVFKKNRLLPECGGSPEQPRVLALFPEIFYLKSLSSFWGPLYLSLLSMQAGVYFGQEKYGINHIQNVYI